MDDKERKIEMAIQKVRRMRSFYSNLIIYILVNITLLVINLLTSPESLWFYWVTLVWGVVLLFQAANTFTLRNPILGEEWERKTVEKLLEKERKEREK